MDRMQSTGCHAALSVDKGRSEMRMVQLLVPYPAEFDIGDDFASLKFITLRNFDPQICAYVMGVCLFHV